MDSRGYKRAPSFNHCHYVPCLRWKLGEYQALLKLDNTVKEQITPLVEIPEIGWDFETNTEAKTIDEHLSLVAKRVKAKWGSRTCFVDLKLLGPSKRMANGTHPLDFVFEDLKNNSCFAIPVTGVDRDKAYQRAVRQAARSDQRGICLRVTIEQAAKRDFKELVATTLSIHNARRGETDFILDLGAPSFQPLDGFRKLILSIIQRVPHINAWRTFTIIGTSFPLSMAEITGSAGILSRDEWLLYESLENDLKAKSIRLPTFGDYAVSHPDVPLLDMRLIKPAATIRYTIDKAWYILKGSNVRDFGFSQYRGLCRRLIESPYYMGPDFSAADGYVRNCAAGNASTGNLTTWRWVGTNHHIQKVICDVANLFGS